MNRPTFYDHDVLLAAATSLLNRLNDVEADNGAGEDLVKALTFCAPDFDGFDLATHLKDRHGWEVDASLVSDLDYAVHDIYAALTPLVRAWVRRENIVARLNVGDTVTTKVDRVEHTGSVVEVRADTAEYVVRIPALGHGLNQQGIGTFGLVYPFEHFHSIVTPTEHFELTRLV